MHLAHLATAAFLFAYPSSARRVDEPRNTLLSIPWPYWKKVTADYTTVAMKRDATTAPTSLLRDGPVPDSYTVDGTAYSYNPWSHPIQGVVPTDVRDAHAEANAGADYPTSTKLPRDGFWPESYTISGAVYPFDIHTHAIRDAIAADAPDANLEVYINTDYVTYDIPPHATIAKFGELVTVDNFFTLDGTIYPWIPFTNAIRDAVPTDIPKAEAYAYADTSPSEPLFTETKPTLKARANKASSDETATQTSQFFPEIVLVSPGSSSTGTKTLPSDFFEVHSASTSSGESVITPIDLTQETVITPIEPWWTTSSSDRVGTTLVKVVVTHTDYYGDEPATISAPTTSSLVTDIGTWTKTVPV